MKQDRRAGFTLIELLVVITIIGILAALTIGATRYAWRSAAEKRTQGEIATLEASLESYRIDIGIFPDSTTTRTDANSNSGSLYTALAGGSKKYFNFKPDQIKVISSTQTNIVDSFGNYYNYYRGTGQSNAPVSFDLWSYGADGQNDTADDLVNWRR